MLTVQAEMGVNTSAVVEATKQRSWWSTKSATVSLSGAARFSAKDVVVKSNTTPANKSRARADSEVLII